VDGVFYSSIICERDKIEEIIDARTSDAIALALRFSAPIFTYKNILEKAGIYLKANPIDANAVNSIDNVLSNSETFVKEETNTSGSTYAKNTITELNEMLDSAVNDENYEMAAKIRDEISKR
jgi:bifunctional DNase/RNase